MVIGVDLGYYFSLGVSIGIGFAIPAVIVHKVVPVLIKIERATCTPGWASVACR